VPSDAVVAVPSEVAFDPYPLSPTAYKVIVAPEIGVPSAAILPVKNAPEGVGLAEGVAVSVAVGCAEFWTITLTDAFARIALLAAYAFAEIKCDPLLTVVELQLIVEGGVDAR
jgi:hypothetical protein